jgi:polyisoprenoid-binding protein YceI
MPLKGKKTMKWFFEPGHSAAEFRARHMMVTWVRGYFKNINGHLSFDPQRPTELAVEATIDATSCWTGEAARDNHLKSADFLHCERFPEIRFKSTGTTEVGPFDYEVTGDLTLRGVTHPVILAIRHLGMWETPWWEDGVDKGPKLRAGFTGTTRIDRYDFGIDWNGELANGGIVVSREIDLTVDVEAIQELG